jgi:uncharacterized protein YndB with AHSA1/START domain
MTDPMRVRLVRQVPAPAKAVFEAWLDPTRIARFMKPAPGIMIVDLEVDPRVGGKFHIEMLEESRASHEAGWTGILETLAREAA